MLEVVAVSTQNQCILIDIVLRLGVLIHILICNHAFEVQCEQGYSAYSAKVDFNDIVLHELC